MKRLFLLIGILLLVLSAVFYMAAAICNHSLSLCLFADGRELFYETVVPTPIPVFMADMVYRHNGVGFS